MENPDLWERESEGMRGIRKTNRQNQRKEKKCITPKERMAVYELPKKLIYTVEDMVYNSFIS